MPPPQDDKLNPWASIGDQLGSALGAGLLKLIEPLAERELNAKARENLDLYAVLVPYGLRISLDRPDNEMIAQIRAHREEKRLAEQKRKRQAVAEYLTKAATISFHCLPAMESVVGVNSVGSSRLHT